MSYKILGKSVNRVDAIAKVTGKAKYAEDYFEREMLVGKVLRSTYAHAKIKNIFILFAVQGKMIHIRRCYM